MSIPEKKHSDQAKRAKSFRKRIDELAADGPHKHPRTPREFTDDAAREAWRKEHPEHDADVT